jgi:hypothetical protein
LEVVQKWLVAVTGCLMPASVDSCAIAGVVDLLRTQGCFGLSARYAICFRLPSSTIEDDVKDFPSYSNFENIGIIFEEVLADMLNTMTFENISEDSHLRQQFASCVSRKLEERKIYLIENTIGRYLNESEEGSSIFAFCLATINAFFDNDLFFTTKTFLNNAKGSFGLCVTSSLDAHRQICLASRGQTVSYAVSNHSRT